MWFYAIPLIFGIAMGFILYALFSRAAHKPVYSWGLSALLPAMFFGLCIYTVSVITEADPIVWPVAMVLGTVLTMASSVFGAVLSFKYWPMRKNVQVP